MCSTIFFSLREELTRDYRLARRDSAPPGHTTPPFPSLHWPPQDSEWSLYTVRDIWRFVLFWTIILFGLFHLGAAGIALLMQTGKARSNWKYLWLVPLAYIFVAGVEALMAGSVVGLMYVPCSCTRVDCMLTPKVESGRVMLLGTLQCRLGFPSCGDGSTSWC